MNTDSKQEKKQTISGQDTEEDIEGDKGNNN